MRFLSLLPLLCFLCSCGRATGAVSYSSVKGILESNCVSCHGGEEPESELRLDSRAAILAGGKSGPAIVPGDADSSLLISAVEDLVQDEFGGSYLVAGGDRTFQAA